MAAVGEPVEEDRGAAHVVVHVGHDRVHGLPHPDLRREVNDGAHARQRAVHGRRVADGGVHQLHAGRQVARAGGADAVHLGLERVEHAHGGAAREERVHEVRADEAGAAGDEDGGGNHGAVNLRTTAAWS